MIQGGQSLSANRDISLTIDGGYNCDYSANPYKTVLEGAPHLSAGTVNIKNFRLFQ